MIILISLVVFVLLIVAAWFIAYSARTQAEDDLAAEQQRTTELNTQLAEYNYINDLADVYENSIMARAWAGSTDIDWAAQLEVLFGAFPDDVQWTDVQISQATPYGGLGTDGTDFGTIDMGSLSFTGRSLDPISTAEWMDAIDALPGFSTTRVDSQAIAGNEGSGTEYWEFSGTTRITFNALSGRTVTEQTEVPQELLDSIEGGDAAPSAEPSAEAEEAN
ncbi:hypothetical protein [Demequina sp. NBRC 110057]|uniref:hypothetical protein n=1 Tax=Demequina sp. NBRC 110057 TaxID=1570346 RepID=UPI000A0656FE|nr:hypothetical protein [Demequina sp. NBRC 110057]